MWHFRFHGPTPEALVKGREAIYFAYFWNDLAADKTRSLSTSDRAIGQQMKVVANNVTSIVLKNSGHWVMEEKPKETMDALLKFL